MNKKAMEMSINLVVTLIIGIIIFGLGMGLFSYYSKWVPSFAGKTEKLRRFLSTVMHLGVQCRKKRN